MHQKLGLGFAVLLSVQAAVAEENALKGEGELGITHTSGNTKTQSLVGKFGLTYQQTSSWKHEAQLEMLRSENDESLTAERYGLNLQSNYSLSKQSYLFGQLRYEDDSFSGYDYQGSLTFGYGHNVIDTERTGLKLKAGIGARQLQLETASDSELETIGVFGLNFRQKIATHSEFTQDFLVEMGVEAGAENTYSESNTGFKVNVTDKVAMKFSMLIKNNSEVPPDREKTDTITAVTLVYSF